MYKHIGLLTFRNMFEMCSHKYPSRDKLGLFTSPMQRQKAITAENP